MNKRHYEHTLPNIRGSLSNTYKGTEIPQRGKKRGKHEQERDRIVPERGHLSGKGFCGSGTRGVHRFRHACQRQLLQGKAGDV